MKIINSIFINIRLTYSIEKIKIIINPIPAVPILYLYDLLLINQK